MSKTLPMHQVLAKFPGHSLANTMMKKTKKLGGVLFDWDMTLARALGDVPRSQILTTLFQRGGYHCSHEEVQQAIASYMQQAQHEEHSADSHKPPQTQEDIAQYYQRLLALLGFNQVSREKALHLYHDYANLPTILYEDTLPTLQHLHEKGLVLGIVSNHTQVARKMMQNEVGQYIPSTHIIISDEIGAYKPIPAVFQQAARQLSLQPDQCAFVGDNLEVDAIGAVEQGGFGLGLWLDRQNSPLSYPFPPNVVRISSLMEVLDYL